MIAVLFARSDSVYKSLPGTDVYDASRDALTFAGGSPVVAHPPCRSWGRLSKFAKPIDGERDLALWAVDQVRACGGVLEHPAASRLWLEKPLPAPGQVDAWGGWTLPISQYWFGHRARKDTFLYIVGIGGHQLPPIPFCMGQSSHVIAQNRTLPDGSRMVKGHPGWRPEVSKSEREATPILLAKWLVEIAERARKQERKP